MADKTLYAELDELTALQEGLTENKVAKLCYTDEAYEENIVESVPDFNIARENNIPNAEPSTLKVNETILSKGFRATGSSITRMLFNHFLGRLSYNVNKVNDFMYRLLSALVSSLDAPNGLPTLDGFGHIAEEQMMKGEANGVASLDGMVSCL